MKSTPKNKSFFSVIPFVLLLGLACLLCGENLRQQFDVTTSKPATVRTRNLPRKNRTSRENVSKWRQPGARLMLCITFQGHRHTADVKKGKMDPTCRVFISAHWVKDVLASRRLPTRPGTRRPWASPRGRFSNHSNQRRNG